MKFVFLLMLMASIAHGEWYKNPVAFKKVGETLELVAQGSGFAERAELPLSKDVSVEGDFTIKDSELSENWHVAAVAIVENQQNFWHLGVVKPPVGHNLDYMFELCEMLDGQWLSQSSLKVEFAERASGVKIAAGSRWNLKISQDEKGVTGVVKDINGNIVFRQRYAFSSRAVTYGRPALRSTGLSGVFSDLKFSAGAAVAVDTEQQSLPPYQSDNFIAEIKAKATGNFYVKQFEDGRWWTIDPLGRGVVVLGVDHITYWGHWCEALGYHPHRRKNEKKYPDPAVWEAETLARLKGWGFTMLGAGSQESLRHRGLFHCVNLGIGTQLATFDEEYYITPNEKRPCSAFPNVFHPEFENYCRYVARTACGPNLNDPWLFGYFSDNELAWWGRGEQRSGLFDAAMRLGSEHTAKQALVDFLKEKSGNDINKFNALWKTGHKSFDELKALTALSSATEERIQIKNDFLRLVAERYFSITTKAIREIDPNHLVMGARFAGTGGADPVVWQVAGKYCDVVTFNCYPHADLDQGVVYHSSGKDAEPVEEHFERYYNYVKRPMLITEWSFPALDAGVPSVHGAGQRFFTQRGRTAATKLFAQTMLSLPYLIGYDYFMWVDEPAQGITSVFPEDSNYGLVNEDCVPYAELTEMFTALHADIFHQRVTPVPAARKGEEKRALAPMESALKLKALNPAPKLPVIERDGKAFVIDNGRLKLEGAIGSGSFVNRISLDGKVYGGYNALVHYINKNGRNEWRDIEEVTAVDIRMENGCAIADIRGVYQNNPCFEVAHRIIVPPGSTKFICQLVELRNTGESDIPVRGLYFRFYGSGKNWSESKSPPRLWGVPEYGCWMRQNTGDYFGALASTRWSGIKINFWQDKTSKSFHPDACYAFEKLLESGEIFTPGKYVTVLGVLGSGGAEAWMNEMRGGNELLETMNRIVPQEKH